MIDLKYLNLKDSMKQKSLSDLLDLLNPPWWKFWLKDNHKAAIIEVISAKGEGVETSSILFQIAMDNKNEDLRKFASLGLAMLAHRGELIDQIDPKPVIEYLLELLKKSNNDEGQTTIDFLFDANRLIYAIGLFGEYAKYTEPTIREFITPRFKSFDVKQNFLYVTSFCLARISHDPQGPLTCIGTQLQQTSPYELVWPLILIKLLGKQAFPLIPILEEIKDKSPTKIQQTIECVKSAPLPGNKGNWNFI